jgi:hypothetical protein
MESKVKLSCTVQIGIYLGKIACQNQELTSQQCSSFGKGSLVPVQGRHKLVLFYHHASIIMLYRRK